MSQRTRYFLIGSVVVVILGLGVGAVAYYNGNLPLKSRTGPEEFSYLPADVNAVAFANVGAIMSSPFTQKLRQVLPTGEEKAKIQEALGLDIERDIDSVVAGGNGAGPAEKGIVLVRGRFNTGHLEALALQHGGRAQEDKGKKLIVSATKTVTRFPAVTRLRRSRFSNRTCSRSANARPSRAPSTRR